MPSPETPAFDPALGLGSDQAFGRALPLLAAGLGILWLGVFDGTWLVHPSLSGTGSTLLSWSALTLCARLTGPWMTRARSARGAIVRTFAASILSGALAAAVGLPLSLQGATWAPGRTLLEVLLDGVYGGALLGFFAGIVVLPLVRHERAIRAIPALDALPRLYAAVAGALLPACAVVLFFSVLLPLAVVLGLACVAVGLAVRAERRRRDWLLSVLASRVPDYRLGELSETPDLTPLPRFAGSAATVDRVLSRTDDGGAAAGHPFRAGGSWSPVARVSLDEAASAGRQALREAGGRGLLAGLILVLAAGVPVCLFALAIGG